MTADTQTRQRQITLVKYLYWIFLAVTCVAVWVPFNPQQPSAGLDESWKLATNQAVAQKLVFGKDFIFTVGPYASIYTMYYHPETDRFMIWGSLGIAACYSLALILLAGYSPFATLCYSIFFVTTSNSARDALLLSYPLLAFTLSCRVTLTSEDSPSLRTSKLLKIGLIVLYVPFGLLPLIKISFLPLAVIIALCCFALFWHKNDKMAAYASLIIPAISLPLFWVIIGQPIEALPAFLINSIPIVTGYTEAMMWPGNTLEIVFYVIAAVLLVYAIARSKAATPIPTPILAAAYGGFLFLAFKMGFVRHDEHALTGGVAIVSATLLFLTVAKTKPAFIALLFSCLALLQIDRMHPGRNLRQAPNAYAQAWSGIVLRLRQPQIIRERFYEGLREINQEYPIPVLSGTTDVYSFDQAELLASGSHWSPRPIFQSYSAYTKKLLALNEAHLHGANAPDHILFRIHAIDNRLPALEDGLSWPTLLNNYSVTKFEGDFAYLDKRAHSRNALSMEVVSTAAHKLDEEVRIPQSDEPLFAEIHIAPTLLGRLLAVAFKPPLLFLSLQFMDGNVRNFRINSGMADSRFLLSPTIENTWEFVLLAKSSKALGADRVVKKMRIVSASGSKLFWKPDYSLQLSTTNLPRDAEISRYPR